MFRLFSDHKGGLLWWQPGAAILQRAKKKKVTNFNDHDRSLLRRLPGATILQRENQQLQLLHQLHIRMCHWAKFRSSPVNYTHMFHEGLSMAMRKKELVKPFKYMCVIDRHTSICKEQTMRASGAGVQIAGGYRRVQEGTGGYRRQCRLTGQCASRGRTTLL